MSLASSGLHGGSRAQQVDYNNRPIEITATSFLNTDRTAQAKSNKPGLRRGNSSTGNGHSPQTPNEPSGTPTKRNPLLRTLVSFSPKDNSNQSAGSGSPSREHRRSQSLQARSILDNQRGGGDPNADSFTMGGQYTDGYAGEGRTRRTSFHGANQDIPALSRQTTRETRREADYAGQGDRAGGAQYQNEPASNGGIGHASQNSISSAGGAGAAGQSANLAALVCNIHRTTGQEPRALVGASTTILGDTLFVFGGRMLSRSRPLLTSDLFALDLVSRHWSKIETKGDIPPPRYFHSMCALGDTHLVCYGGMSPTMYPQAQGGNIEEQAPEVVVMSDIHILDVDTRTWKFIPAKNTPQGRYAHCAAILPSSAAFASQNAPLSAIHNNASADGNPASGNIGVTIDGAGGAEMVIVGGQDSSNHYIEQISVFNLRSLRWSGTSTLGKSCGAYRSVVAGPIGIPASKIGMGENATQNDDEEGKGHISPEAGSTMLIYSNYNFLDVRLELQIRAPDGTLTEKTMNGDFAPPGLRFPNGGVIDNHFVVSGTYLTSSKQEYALWSLDLKTLIWERIDTGPNVFSQGSWNRGVLWNRRNAFVILGNRKRSLVDDYNHRRLNFTNMCVVELEAFALYDNPRRLNPMGNFHSASAPFETYDVTTSQDSTTHNWAGGGRPHFSAASELGKFAMGVKELSDMDILAVGGERIPVNSRIVARRWGPYFNDLLRESALNSQEKDKGINPTRPLPPPRGESQMSQASTVTITQSTSISSTTTLVPSMQPPSPHVLLPMARPRTLYLPHTYPTIQALIHYLYTSSLPPKNTHLCTTQVLCSLLQLARPYRIDGLIEAVVERLHQTLDGRNAAAVFNAAAMAAGGGRDIANDGRIPRIGADAVDLNGDRQPQPPPKDGLPLNGSKSDGKLSINTTVANSRHGGGHHHARKISADIPNSASTTISAGSSMVSDVPGSPGYAPGTQAVIKGQRWTGDLSPVVGLQKRGLRGLMEGRRLRERGRMGSEAGQGGNGPNVGPPGGMAASGSYGQNEHDYNQPGGGGDPGNDHVGLGIA
jgi:hypothetical protein